MRKVGSAYSKPSTWNCSHYSSPLRIALATGHSPAHVHTYCTHTHTYILHTYLHTSAGYVSLKCLPGFLAADITSHGESIGGFPGAHIHLRLPFPPITAPAFEPVLRGCQLVTRRRHGSVDSRDIEQASVWPPRPRLRR